MENPFTVRGTIQNPSDFIGRKAELLHIVTRLKTMQSCSVVGERRIGKSSLLYHLFQTGNERLNDSRFRFVYIELTDASAQTVVDFLQTVLQALNLPSDSIKDDNKPNRNLVAFDSAIKTMVASGTKVVLCLDEFEGLFANKQEFNDGFFNHLRSMINQRRLALVTASWKSLEVYAIEEKLTSPFFNLLSITELGDFTPEDVESFIDYYQPAVQFTAKELEFINWYSEPHPAKLQIFCDMILQWREQDWDNDTAKERIAKAYEILGGKHDWRKWKRNVAGILSCGSIKTWLENIKIARDLGTGI
ncbi:AAA family ATPase [Thiothrix caldifontis]|uniref:AAA family ATPase n=1 Tax=Thiothrix caldifontis TaxID=525918 RepID=UPI001114C40A|nr:AAA family ATPase [Thiothrix caldifontis]